MQTKTIQIVMNVKKATLSSALDIEARILPFKLCLKMLLGKSLLKLVISTRYSYITQIRSKRKLHKFTLLKTLMARFEL